MVAVVAPVVHDAPDVGEAPEPVALRRLSRNLPLKLSTKAFWVGLPGWMKFSAAPDRSLQKRIALLVNSGPLSQTTALGAAALPSSSRKRASLAPVIEVATSWPDMKSIDQRSFGRVGMATSGPEAATASCAAWRGLAGQAESVAVLALVGRHQALALQHAGRRQAAVAGMPPGQLAQAVRQRPGSAARLRAVDRCIPSRRQVRRSLAGWAFRRPPAAFLLAAGVTTFLTFR